MSHKETAHQFHHRLTHSNSGPGQFIIYKTDNNRPATALPNTRRDFYKISLIINAEGILAFADKRYHIKGGAIIFLNPMVPYSWQPISHSHKGYSCLFTEDFLTSHLKADSLSYTSLFKVNGNHVIVPGKKSINFLSTIFERMIEEMDSSYIHKYEVLRSYVQIILHEAQKIQPLQELHPASHSARISTSFLSLLDTQFPIVSPGQTLTLKNASEFARQLAIHPNHLNKALKEITGSTTTELISARIVKEAKALLLHSDWDIAEIGFTLGFGHASNFNIFFKKQTGVTPNNFRHQPASLSI